MRKLLYARTFAGCLLLLCAACARAGDVAQSPPPDAGTPRVLALSEALKIALDANIDLALSRAQQEIAQVRSQAAKTAMAPALDLGASVTGTNGLVQGAYGDFRNVDNHGESAGLAVSWRANLGARIHDAMAARRELDAAWLDTLSNEQKLILLVVELYENLVLARAGMDIAQDLLASSQEFQKIATARFEGGVALGTDEARARANVAASQEQRLQAENLWRDTSVRLAVVLRLDPAQYLQPADTTLEAWQLPEGMDVGSLAKQAAERPDVAAAQTRAEAEQESLKSRWWDLVAPDLFVEWRLYGVGGSGDQASTPTAQALSNAAGSAGRSLSAWQNAATALGTGANPLPALSSAAGSAGRSYYAYKGLLDSPHQDIDGLSRQERFAVGVGWSLSIGKVARIKEQRIHAKIAKLQAEKAEEAAVGEVRLAQQDMDTALQSLAYAADELHAAEDTNRLSLARFRAGTALAFEVLNAQDLRAEARLKLARHTAALNIAQTRLLTAAGTAYDSLPPRLRGVGAPEEK